MIQEVLVGALMDKPSPGCLVGKQGKQATWRSLSPREGRTQGLTWLDGLRISAGVITEAMGFNSDKRRKS